MADDFNSLIENQDFEWVVLPSHGECYPHKRDRMAVKYMTVAHEEVLYKDGCDALLRRVIVDPVDFDVDRLCVGDRNAILIHIRRMNFGDKFKNPVDGEIVDLSLLKPKPFSLKGDDNGLFTYLCIDGRAMKFKMLTHHQEIETMAVYKDEPDKLSAITLAHCIGNASVQGCGSEAVFQSLTESEMISFAKYIVFNRPDLDFSVISDIAIDESLFSDAYNPY